MKKLILILGPNGVGKSTASAALLKILPNSAYIDSDSLRMMNPARGDEVIAVQKQNILALMRNYFSASFVEYVVFPYGYHAHRKKMLEDMLEEPKAEFNFEVITILLTCSEKENVRRMQNDGRNEERISYSIENTRTFFDGLDCPKIDTTGLTPEQTAERMIDIFRGK